MSEYRSQVDGRRLQREMAANPSRVRAVPLAEEAEFERAMAQLSDASSRGGQHHASGLTHAEEWHEQLEEAREDALHEPQAPTAPPHGHGVGGMAGLWAVPAPRAGGRGRDDECGGQDEEDTFELGADLQLEANPDTVVDTGGELNPEPLPLRHDGDSPAPTVASRGPDALQRWIDRREEAREAEDQDRWLDEQGDCFETALELVEALHLDLAEPPPEGQGGSDDQHHASDVDAWLDATLDADYSGHSLDVAAPEGADAGADAPAGDAVPLPLDDVAPADDGAGIEATDDGEGKGRRHAGDAEVELVAQAGGHARDGAHQVDSRQLQGAADVQTQHDLNVDVGDFSLRERVHGAVHHFEVVSRGSPVRSVELIRHADGQMTANVTVDGDYAGGLAEFLERMRSRMGRLKLGLLRLLVDERTVAELRPDRKAVL